MQNLTALSPLSFHRFTPQSTSGSLSVIWCKRAGWGPWCCVSPAYCRISTTMSLFSRWKWMRHTNRGQLKLQDWNKAGIYPRGGTGKKYGGKPNKVGSWEQWEAQRNSFQDVRQVRRRGRDGQRSCLTDDPMSRGIFKSRLSEHSRWTSGIRLMEPLCCHGNSQENEKKCVNKGEKDECWD